MKCPYCGGEITKEKIIIKTVNGYLMTICPFCGKVLATILMKEDLVKKGRS